VRKDTLAKLESSAGVMTTAAWGAERPHAKQQARDRRSARHAIGGVAIHLIQSLDGYIGTLAALDAAGYRDTEGPGEDERIVDAQLAHARRGVSAAEQASTFGEMRTKHERLAALERKPSDAQFDALLGVTEHYCGVGEANTPSRDRRTGGPRSTAEHVPHVHTLYSQWKMAADARR
jgi:hypothetical protein